jgi:cytochrome P450
MDRQFDPFSDDYYQGAWETFRWLRDEVPVYRNDEGNFWALSRYEDVHDGLVDWRTFISSAGVMLDQLNTPGFHGPSVMPGLMIIYDPPEHERLRRLVSTAFTPRGVSILEDDIRRRVRHYLDQVPSDGDWDFVGDFANIFPAEIVFDMFDVPAGDRELAWELCKEFFDVHDADPRGVSERSQKAYVDLAVYLTGLAADARRNRSEGLIARLTQATFTAEDGTEEQLSDQEIGNFLTILIQAGTETTTKLMATAAVQLARHPAAWDLVAEDPGLIPAMLEEAGRYDSPAQYLCRRSTVDVTRHGVTIPAGSNVLMLVASANRDERVYAEPDRFDITREMTKPPLTFNVGVHYCLGANLARLESRIAFEEVRDRFPGFLDVDEDGLERTRSVVTGGYCKVPVRPRKSAG